MKYGELIRAMRERESGALEELQTLFTPLVRYVVSPILPDGRDREECVSDVFLRAWDSFGDYDPDRASLTAWLGAIARNAALNRRRANARRPGGEPLDEALAAADDAGPEQAALRAETARALWAAVDRLDRRERDLFLRKYYYYQSTAQIAAELGLTVRGVEGRLYRIRKRLQDELGGVYRG